MLLEKDEIFTILTSASSGPKEKSLLKITVYSSGHLRRYFSGLKTDLARFHVVIAVDLSFYVSLVTPRGRTHKQKDLPVVPGKDAGASLSVNVCSSIWTAFPLLKQSSPFSESNIQEWGLASLAPWLSSMSALLCIPIYATDVCCCSFSSDQNSQNHLVLLFQ